MDTSELDALLGLGSQPPVPAKQKKAPSDCSSGEVWVTWDEWMWRQGDRIFDAARKARGQRAVPASRREADLQAFLASQEERARRAYDDDPDEPTDTSDPTDDLSALDELIGLRTATTNMP